MADIRYVVAMIRREPPDKAHLPHRDVIRAEFPLEDFYKFINQSIFLPNQKRYTSREVKAAIKESVKRSAGLAMKWLVDSREGP